MRIRQVTIPRIGVIGENGTRNGRVGLGVREAHDENGRADHDESEESADVGQVGQDTERQEAGGKATTAPGEDGGLPGRAVLVVDGAEELRAEEPVAGHGQPDRGAGSAS